MEFLGYAIEPPTLNDGDKWSKWNYIELSYPNDEIFNDATSKLIRILNNDGKCVVLDSEKLKYRLDIVHGSCDIYDNTNLEIETNSERGTGNAENNLNNHRSVHFFVEHPDDYGSGSDRFRRR